MRLLIAAVMLLVSFSSHALMIHFSGTVIDTKGDGYGYRMGDSFKGYVNFVPQFDFSPRESDHCTHQFSNPQAPDQNVEICGYGGLRDMVSDSVLGLNNKLNGMTPGRPAGDSVTFSRIRGDYSITMFNTDSHLTGNGVIRDVSRLGWFRIIGTEDLFKLALRQDPIVDLTQFLGGNFTVTEYRQSVLARGLSVSIKNAGVPEPATWGMLLFGLIFCLLKRPNFVDLR